jgi:5-methylcytosine-specific restriction endonuclease McrA
MSSDDKFIDYIGRTTDKPDRVRYRAETWRQRLDAAIIVPSGEIRAFSRKIKVKLHDDDPTCAICYQHIQTPEDAEIDHIKHYWRGGATLPENARLTHRHCNRSRGDR